MPRLSADARGLGAAALTKCLLGALLFFTAVPGFSHEAAAPGVGPRSWRELGTAWSFEPGVVIPLALSLWLYGQGVLRLWRTSGAGRGIRWLEFWCYICGWLTLVVALVSPLHPWGSVLFSAHMTQHELLMLVAAPLLVLGRPMIAFLWALPRARARQVSSWTKARWWEGIWHSLSNPLSAWVLHAVVLWAWHIPRLFEATLTSEFVHALQHASFLGSALLFWWALIHGRQRMMGYGLAVLYMFTTALHSGLLGALLTFARTAWYDGYLYTTAAWGLTPLEDQQLGGLIMWIPAGLVYIIAGLALFAGWLRESDRRAAGLRLGMLAACALPLSILTAAWAR
jgi:putative membrane protein